MLKPLIALAILLLTTAAASAQEMPAEPTVIFLHYWGQGPAEKLAAGVRAAVNQTGGNRR